MGAKISIDSATLMNKGLEVIEACHLYGAGLDEVEVLIHPESIVHSLVEYHDGSLLAHMGIPDMRIPIAHALSYPRRMKLHLDALDLVQLSRLSFAQPNHDMFPCLNLAKQALTSGPSYPIVLNAANEVAVEFFLGGRIPFLDIARLNRQALEAHTPRKVESLEDVQDIDQEARLLVRQGLQP
jgi:1-deoxy-D-xylulose-5-phosphate reductoisomerase